VGNNDLVGIGNLNLATAMQQGGGNSSNLFNMQFGSTYSTMEGQLEEFASLFKWPVWGWEWEWEVWVLA
jgi:hypothetical protein